MKEFDPNAERHYPLIVVKAVEPGCTTEWQVENCQTGEVYRLSTTEDTERDERAFLRLVQTVAMSAWLEYGKREHAIGTVATT